MEAQSNLKAGKHIVFSKKPAGSYTREGETYLIEEVSEKYVYFSNITNGGKTYDPISLVKAAQFEIL